jgi:hypothetical protein
MSMSFIRDTAPDFPEIKSIDGLTVARKSTIPSICYQYGLFARRNIAENESIGTYPGVFVTDDWIKTLPKDAKKNVLRYAIRTAPPKGSKKNNHLVTPTDITGAYLMDRGNVVACINEAPPGKLYNIMWSNTISTDGFRPNTIELVAMREIAEGAELFFYYGDSYPRDYKVEPFNTKKERNAYTWKMRGDLIDEMMV